MAPAAVKDQLEGQMVGDRYRLQRRIGSGGMSLVYLAEQVNTARPLAIKLLRSAFVNLPGFVRRFEQEARACSRLSHPNCVDVIDFGVAFGSPYLVMEHIEGSSLSQLIAEGPVEPRRAVALLGQILVGLAHAHQHGVVHRDLKPGNVMLTPGGGGEHHIKIMDFGTAQILNAEPDAPTGGTEIGTPFYMAPEQGAGRTTDPRTDLYAVGVIAFEMLTAVRPYVADDHRRVMQMHIESPIPSVRALHPAIGVSPELEAVIVRAMQKRAADRFPDAEAFARALAAVPEAQRRAPTSPVPRQPPVVTTAPSPPKASALLEQGARRAGSRGRAPLIALALALTAAILGLIVLYKAGVF